MLKQPPPSPLSGFLEAFETAAQAAAFWSDLRAGKAPLKYAYVGSAALTHDRLARTSNYSETVGEVALEADAIGSITPHPVQLVEVGPGNGAHTRALLAALQTRGVRYSRYLGLDYSGVLLRMAADAIVAPFAPLEVTTHQVDIETERLDVVGKWRKRGAILMASIGNTIANVEDPPAVLRRLREAATEGDYLAIGFATPPPVGTDPVKAYLTPEFRAAALEPLRMAGIPTGSGEFRMWYDSEERAVRACFRLGETVTLHFGEERFVAKEGATIDVFTSRRRSVSETEEMLSEAGWSIMSSHAAEGHGAIIAKRG